MKKALITALLISLVGTVGQVRAQYATPPPAPNGQILDGNQLDQLLGPIALYPDPLIAEVLPAATQPSQIALAYNYISQGGDPNGIDQQNWDGSVKAVAHYPDVLKTLGDNLPWTSTLGQAFLNQPADVMDSVQRLRAQAQNLGNLETTPQETIETDDGDIEIVPADPDLIYVPEYDPGIIFYQRPYGRHFLNFGVGFHIGGWLNHDFDWHGHNVFVWGHDHPRPANWWHAPAAQRREQISHNKVWHPGARPAGRPGVVNRGDRGFEPRPAVRSEPPREVRPAPRPAVHPEPPREVRPSQPVRPEPPREVRPVEPREIRPAPVVREPAPAPRPQPAPVAPRPVPAPVAPRPTPAPSAPSRPSGPSAFSGGSGSETRAASSRGAVSRGGGAPSGGGHSGGKR